MQFCNSCQVNIRGNKIECPLCNNTLPEEEAHVEDVFPEIPPYFERHLAIRIMVFISIVAIVFSFAFHGVFPSDYNWPVLVLLGLISLWISLTMVIRNRHHITKNIIWQVLIVSILSILWDWKVGWRGWSLNYVIPFTYVAAMFVMYVVAKVMKLKIRDYITYLLLDGVFGILPILFFLFDWIYVATPSIICVAVSIIFICAIFIFEGENIKSELKKRMHV